MVDDTNNPKMKKILGLIPARGGSKGIPRKNLYPVMGKPLIQYSIEAALNSRFINQVMLSTEDSEIKAFAQQFDIDTSYSRPTHLASDTATTYDAVVDLMSWLETHHKSPDVLVLLQPTSPLRDAAVIDRALKDFFDSQTSSLVGVNKMKEHPFKSLRKKEGGWSYLAKPQKHVSRRQDYSEDYFVINGSIYIFTPEWVKHKQSFVVEGETQLFETSKIVGLDIDEMLDVYQVEAYLRSIKS